MGSKFKYFKYFDSVGNRSKFRLSVSILMICQADFMSHEICVAIIFSYYKKNETLQKLRPPKNFMCNRRSARHIRIVEYEPVYFPKAIKYDESQQKCIRGLPKTQLHTNPDNQTQPTPDYSFVFCHYSISMVLCV
jgi:hypothetical protein